MARDYYQIPKYHTKQRILVPAGSESEEEDENCQESPISLKSPIKKGFESDDEERDYQEHQYDS